MAIKPVPKSPSTPLTGSQDPHASYETAVAPSSDKVESIFRRLDNVQSFYRKNRPVVDVDNARKFHNISSFYEGMTSSEIDFHSELSRHQIHRMIDCNEDFWKRLEQSLYEEVPIPEQEPKKIGFCIIL